MKRLLDMHPDRYKQFQFSILQILPKTMTKDSVIKTESLYKKKAHAPSVWAELELMETTTWLKD